MFLRNPKVVSRKPGQRNIIPVMRRDQRQLTRAEWDLILIRKLEYEADYRAKVHGLSKVSSNSKFSPTSH